MKKLLVLLIILNLTNSCAFADKYVPEFDKMKQMRCDIVETTFDSNDKQISVTGYFRIFRLDEENKLIYLQKNLIDGLIKYDNDKIDFYDEMMTDDSIIRTSVEIDRTNMKYNSSSDIEYDNPEFEPRKSVGVGECRYL